MNSIEERVATVETAIKSLATKEDVANMETHLVRALAEQQKTMSSRLDIHLTITLGFIAAIAGVAAVIAKFL